jgi:hypothetical protein
MIAAMSAVMTVVMTVVMIGLRVCSWGSVFNYEICWMQAPFP